MYTSVELSVNYDVSVELLVSHEVFVVKCPLKIVNLYKFTPSLWKEIKYKDIYVN